MKSLQPLLDLEGRRPSAKRPMVLAALAIIVVSTLGLGATLIYQYECNRELFTRSFGKSLYVGAQITSLPKEIALSAFSQEAGATLGALADTIALLYDSCITRSPDSVRNRRTTTLLSNDSIIYALNSPAPPYPLRRIEVTDGLSWSTVVDAVGYSVSAPFAQHPGSLIAGRLGNLKQSRFGQIAGLLESWQKSFPSDPDLQRKTDSTMKASHIPEFVASPTLVARISCALDLLPDSSTMSELRQEVIRKQQLLAAAALESKHPSWEGQKGVDYDRHRDSLIQEYKLGPQSRPFLFLNIPASPMPPGYDHSVQDWFVAGYKDSTAKWSATYPEVGTGIPIVVLSVPIMRKVGGEQQKVGLLWIDFYTNRLADFPKPGYAYLVNFALLLAATLILLLIIVGSSRKRFDLVLWSYSTLLMLYAVKVFIWALDANQSQLGTWATYPDFFLSMLTSISFLMAAIFVFKNFKYDIRDTQRAREESQTGTLGKFFAEFHMIPDSYATAVVSSLLAALATACLDGVIQAFFGGSHFSLISWLDAILSASVAIIFGYYFAYWAKAYFQKWFVVTSFLAFVIYGVVQLPHPLMATYSRYWFMLAFAKMIPLFVVVFAIYFWSKHRNFDRVRRTGTRATILGRIGVPYSFITIAGTLDDTEKILFVDRSTLGQLGWIQCDINSDAPNEYTSNEEIADWQLSELGDDLYYPESDKLRASDMFAEGQFYDLKAAVMQKPVKVRVKKILNDNITKRVTLIKMIRDYPIALRTKIGKEKKIAIVSLTAWKDLDKSIDRIPAAQSWESTWYFVLLAVVLE